MNGSQLHKWQNVTNVTQNMGQNGLGQFPGTWWGEEF